MSLKFSILKTCIVKKFWISLIFYNSHCYWNSRKSCNGKMRIWKKKSVNDSNFNSIIYWEVIKNRKIQVDLSLNFENSTQLDWLFIILLIIHDSKISESTWILNWNWDFPGKLNLISLFSNYHYISWCFFFLNLFIVHEASNFFQQSISIIFSKRRISSFELLIKISFF